MIELNTQNHIKNNVCEDLRDNIYDNVSNNFMDNITLPVRLHVLCNLSSYSVTYRVVDNLKNIIISNIIISNVKLDLENHTKQI